MKPLSFAEIAAFSGGRLVRGRPERVATRVCSDSRAILPGDLFIALSGERFDGHAFLADAVQKGALAALVDREVATAELPAGFGLVRVEDVLVGLQRLAAGYRETLKTRVVAVTGSNGKTSTKELLASVLASLGPVHKTEGNLNNHIGVPLTLLQLEESHSWAVVEMGMNHPGELRPLVALARPEIGVVTQAGWAHIEHFTDREAIAREKGEVLYGLPPQGLAVVNGDNPRLRALAGDIPAPVCWVGESPKNDVRVQTRHLDEKGTTFRIEADGLDEELFIPVLGAHMAENAALAVAVGLHLGLDAQALREGLARAVLPKGRLALKPRKSGWLLDDSYNASPDSMAAAFRTVMGLPGQGRGVALLGSMGELGEKSEALHRWVGGEVVRHGLSLVFALGPGAAWLAEGALEAGLDPSAARTFTDHEDLTAAYLAEARDDDRIVVKGSRSQTMERVVARLEH
jgi:UDP-N-acetylmuramoyl-tripeptide--D-alanyl-D-alanine ligase